MAGVCVSLEEVILGHDGANDGIGNAIDEAKDMAKADDNASSMQVVISLSPSGSSSFAKSGQPFRVVTTQPNATIVATLLRKLRDDPSDVFSGKVRVVFRSANDSEHIYKSFERTMRGVPMPENGGLTANPGGMAGEFAAYLKPIMDQNIQMMATVIDMTRAQAQLLSGHAQMAAHTGALTQGFADMIRPGQRASGGDDVPPLLKALGLAVASNSGSMPGGPAGKTAASVAGNMIAGGAPPPSPIPRSTVTPPPSPIPRGTTNAPGSLVPTGKSTTSKADVEEWARQNPAEARAMAIDAYKRGL